MWLAMREMDNMYTADAQDTIYNEYLKTVHTTNTQSGADNVNSPKHYNQHGIEAIQAIEASMSLEEFKGYLKGNCLKYLWRYRYKGNPVEDLQKAQWYLNLLIKKVK